jgi:hypothetical protein
MAEISASIAPVRTDAALRKVLAEDFPEDCANLPIQGGWGYNQEDAIVFVRSMFPVPQSAAFIPFEKHIVEKILYEELIIFRPKNYRFTGISHSLKSQRLVQNGDKMYDRLDFVISCWTEWHWDQLIRVWKENDLGMRPGFDEIAHAAKSAASMVQYEREFWFDITDVFNHAEPKNEKHGDVMKQEDIWQGNYYRVDTILGPFKCATLAEAQKLVKGRPIGKWDSFCLRIVRVEDGNETLIEGREVGTRDPDDPLIGL